MKIKENEMSCINTDKNIWRKVKDDYYSPSIHVTQEGNIGINVGGHVIVMSIEKWFILGCNEKGDIMELKRNEVRIYCNVESKFLKFEKELIKLFKDNGFKCWASGYDLTNGIRDLCFEKKK